MYHQRTAISGVLKDLSIVIPAFNEEESLAELLQEIDIITTANQIEYEAILLDDGSTDGTWSEIEKLSKKYSTIKGIRFMRNYGKAAALDVGFQKSNAHYVATMDADLQDNPEELPAMLLKMKEEKLDLLSGWKKKRYDPWIKTFPSKIYNRVTRWFTGIQLHDFNCGFKLYRNQVVKSIELQGEMHRYIPILARNAGFNRIDEYVVKHRERKFGVSKYGGFARMIPGFLDLLTILFLSKFGKKPMHLFGTLGGLSFVTGGLVSVYLVAQKLIAIQNDLPYREVVDQPLFYMALVAVVIGVQLFVGGFIGELLTRTAANRRHYLIAEETAVNS